MDLNLRKAEQAIRDGDAKTANEATQRVVSLQAEHGLEPAPEDLFRYAEAWAAAGEPKKAGVGRRCATCRCVAGKRSATRRRWI